MLVGNPGCMSTPGYDELMQADIGRMYWAATKAIPDKADDVAAVAKHLAAGLEDLNVQAALAGDPRATTVALDIGSDVHAVLRQAVGSLNHGATAVLNTAKDYELHDQRAKEDLAALGLRLPDVADPHPAGPGAALPDVAAPGATAGDEEVESTPDPIDVDYQQSQQKDGPDLPATPTPGAQ